jgi:Cytochrome P460
MPGAIIFSGSHPAPAAKNEDNQSHNEKENSFGVVYANSLAREAASAEPSIPFPRGSIIVREKLKNADDTQPQLLAVMIKRARGFNPAANDWEFLVVDGAVSKIRERQKRGSCLDCHASQASRDYVYPPLAQ